MKPTQAKAWKCSTCKLVTPDKKAAEKCCTCEKCGAPVATPERPGYRHSLCEKCMRKQNKRYAQERLRRAEKDLADARSHLLTFEEE